MVQTSPPTPFYIQREELDNTFWPIIDDPGLMASWFLPDEIDYLNPNLELQLWQGTLLFLLKKHGEIRS